MFDIQKFINNRKAAPQERKNGETKNTRVSPAVTDSIHVISSGQFVSHGTPAELSRDSEVRDCHLGVATEKLN